MRSTIEFMTPEQRNFLAGSLNRGGVIFIPLWGLDFVLTFAGVLERPVLGTLLGVGVGFFLLPLLAIAAFLAARFLTAGGVPEE